MLKIPMAHRQINPRNTQCAGWGFLMVNHARLVYCGMYTLQFTIYNINLINIQYIN